MTICSADVLVVIMTYCLGACFLAAPLAVESTRLPTDVSSRFTSEIKGSYG